MAVAVAGAGIGAGWLRVGGCEGGWTGLAWAGLAWVWWAWLGEVGWTGLNGCAIRHRLCLHDCQPSNQTIVAVSILLQAPTAVLVPSLLFCKDRESCSSAYYLSKDRLLAKIAQKSIGRATKLPIAHGAGVDCC